MLVWIRVQDDMPTDNDPLLLWTSSDDYLRGFRDVKGGEWLDMHEYAIEVDGITVTHWAKVRGPIMSAEVIQWVPVSERLPDTTRAVRVKLLTLFGYRETVAYRSAPTLLGGWFYPSGESTEQYGTITEWAEIPEPEPPPKVYTDTNRLEWLVTGEGATLNARRRKHPKYGWRLFLNSLEVIPEWHKTWREAIDEAMRKTEGKP